ncbi:gliding motility protein GldD [Sediminicola sp. YIK13]|uniref:gliding motility lipoprotein GldD n=1 Tax=Sediminicola sp. YIK13 TaxID=1453352 RepID=UPI000720EE0F|nr:gliding motility lipoprotein GldD [Sediminicola sp. YIK13]ALM08708.1 gliding motility protein GldD [Sediminicola sp. YIK13]
MTFRSIFFIVFLISFMGCKEEVLPKPKAMLRLEYPEMASKKLEVDCAYAFEYNAEANLKLKKDCSLTLEYPEMKGALFISYKSVEGNLTKLMSDAQKFSYEHVAKADNILEQPFVNEADRVYGMYYEVKGNAASQSQFYLTDSISHFVTGSLYFYTKPNYDSILPAAVHLQKDIRHIMETMRWKD